MRSAFLRCFGRFERRETPRRLMPTFKVVDNFSMSLRVTWRRGPSFQIVYFFFFCLTHIGVDAFCVGVPRYGKVRKKIFTEILRYFCVDIYRRPNWFRVPNICPFFFCLLNRRRRSFLRRRLLIQKIRKSWLFPLGDDNVICAGDIFLRRRSYPPFGFGGRSIDPSFFLSFSHEA